MVEQYMAKMIEQTQLECVLSQKYFMNVAIKFKEQQSSHKNCDG